MAPYGCSHLAKARIPLWPDTMQVENHMEPYGCGHMAQAHYCTIWQAAIWPEPYGNHMAQAIWLPAIWLNMAPYGYTLNITVAIWRHMAFQEPYGYKWRHMAPYCKSKLSGGRVGVRRPPSGWLWPPWPLLFGAARTPHFPRRLNEIGQKIGASRLKAKLLWSWLWSC